MDTISAWKIQIPATRAQRHRDCTARSQASYTPSSHMARKHAKLPRKHQELRLGKKNARSFAAISTGKDRVPSQSTRWRFELHETFTQCPEGTMATLHRQEKITHSFQDEGHVQSGWQFSEDSKGARCELHKMVRKMCGTAFWSVDTACN